MRYDIHTCHAQCPCHTGGEPREEFAEFGPERPVGGMKSLADRVTTDIHDSIDMQAELDRLRAALERLTNVTARIVSSPRRTHPGQPCVSYEHLPVAMHDEALLALSAARRGLAADAPGGLRAGEFTAEYTGPLSAEQLADKLRDGVPVHRFVADPDAAGPDPDFPERTPEQIAADERARWIALAKGTG